MTLATLPEAGTLPSNYNIGITLMGDTNDNVSRVVFICFDGTTRFGTQEMILTDLYILQGQQVTEADLAPIVAVTVDLVGYGNGAATEITSGGGNIRYASPNSVNIANAVPPCVALDYQTAETFDDRAPPH
ncbi:MAG TPA: hypothetical protein VMU32_06525 [Solirubrobacteraceae bacterium]|nr:hypothetical protein [Solirubrobacteraceae bacterium]